MIGILAELIVSWVLLRIILRKNLAVLGFGINKNRLVDLGTGLLLSALCCTVYNVMTAILADNNWVRNKNTGWREAVSGSWWVLKSVLFEELIFRGALLYVLIKKAGVVKACIISSIAFGVYHWFSYNVFGNPLMMIIVFLMTAVAGAMFAFAFARTNSLYLPVGLHFGWNFFSIVVFSNGPLGQQLFVRENSNSLEGTVSLIVFLFQLLALPLLVFWYLRVRYGKVKKE
jgi:uncharacterized protein